nr:PEP-CTERM sorting domain-containing protein [uncultured Desulfobulbus sp.]
MKKKFGVGLACGVVMLVMLSRVACASLIYNYTGNPFTYNQSSWGCQLGDSIIATVTFSDNIDASFTGEVPASDILFYGIGTATHYFTANNVNGAWVYAKFIMQNGKITNWDLEAGGWSASPSDSGYAITKNWGTEVYDQKEYSWWGANYAGNYNTPGNWAPDVISQNPVPEPTTILLFGAGIVGLTGIARRKMN